MRGVTIHKRRRDEIMLENDLIGMRMWKAKIEDLDGYSFDDVKDKWSFTPPEELPEDDFIEESEMLL